MAGQTSIDYANVSRWPVLIAVDAMTRPAGVAVNRPVCIVGAPGRAHLKIDSRQISKTHALIIQETDGVCVRDLCSTNKTLVNGKPVREAWLKNHDIIRFGTVAYRCQSGFTNRVASEMAPAGELHFIDETGEPRLQSIEHQTFLIGSRKGCDLVLGGQEIAKAHAVLFSRDGKRFILDLTGERKTLVNDAPIREAELQPGDAIQIGEYRFAYYLAGAALDPAAAQEQAAPQEVLEVPEAIAEEPAIAEELQIVEAPIATEEPAIAEEPQIVEAPIATEEPVVEAPVSAEQHSAIKEPRIVETPQIEDPELALEDDDLVVLPESIVDPAPSSEELELASEPPVIAEEPAPAMVPAAPQPQIPAPQRQIPAMIPAAVAPAAAQSEPEHLRHEPLLLKSAIAFPVFAEKKPEGQLELTLDGDVLTGSLKRPAEPPKLFPRANKRLPVTNREQLLAQSFIVKK